MSAPAPAPIAGLVLITPAQRRFVQTLQNYLENDPLPKESIETLKNIFTNILKQPNELKLRRLKAANPKFHDRVGRYKTAVKVLEHAGFVYDDGEFSRKGVLQEEDTWELQAVADALSSPKVPIRPNDVLFYELKAEWGEFSNFYPAGIKIDNKIWPTTEHYFQAQKFAGTKFEDEIRAKATPDEAKTRGSDRVLPLRKDWEQVKDDIMYKACLAKFTQHPKLGQKLRSTGKATIIENAPSDSYWGNGPDGSGKNKLGIILMKVRAELEAQAEAHAALQASEKAAQQIEKQHQAQVSAKSSGGPALSANRVVTSSAAISNAAPKPVVVAPAHAPVATRAAPAPVANKAPASAPVASKAAPAPAVNKAAPAPAPRSSAPAAAAKPPAKK